jgi:D-3-phosphoglycerate dehydrogenase
MCSSKTHLAIFYRDQLGMLGRVGTALGNAGVNIVSAAAVGRQPDLDTAEEAVMIITADTKVPPDVLTSLVAGADFFDARAVSL